LRWNYARPGERGADVQCMKLPVSKVLNATGVSYFRRQVSRNGAADATGASHSLGRYVLCAFA